MVQITDRFDFRYKIAVDYCMLVRGPSGNETNNSAVVKRTITKFHVRIHADPQSHRI